MGWLRADDLTGATDGVQQVTFGLGETAYVLDLGEENLAKLREVLDPYVRVALAYGQMPAAPDRDAPPPQPGDAPAAAPVAAPVGRSVARSGRRAAKVTPSGRAPANGGKRPRRERRPATRPVVPPEQRPTVREWAAAQGIEVKPTGRISADVMSRYQEAFPD